MDNGTLIIIIAVVMITLVVAVFVYQIISEKIKRKKIKKEKMRLNELKKQLLFEACYKVNGIIKYNELLLENFIVSIGEYTMSEITTKIKNLLKEIIENQEYKNIFSKLEETFEQDNFNENIEKLINVKSNLWNKKEEETINYFKDFEKIYLENKSEEENYKDYQMKKEEFLRELKYEKK